MNFFILLILFACFNVNFQLEIEEELLCPKSCRCYLWERMNRADCGGQKDKILFTVETGINKYVQVLDLSYNSITQLYNLELKDANYQNVIYLDLSHNQIKDVGLFAFEEMNNLNILDLSHNHLRMLSYKTFKFTNKLKKLDISNNNLYIKGPLLEISSLKILDLSKCQIDNLESDIFLGLPSIEEIFLEDNQLIKVNVDVIKNLNMLVRLELKGNEISCDGNTKKLQKWLKTNSIPDSTGCQKKDVMFERLMMMPPPKENIKSERNLAILWNLTEEELIGPMVTCPPMPLGNITCNGTKFLFALMPELGVGLIGFVIGIGISLIVWCIFAYYSTTSRHRDNSYRQVTTINEILPVNFEPLETPPPPYREAVKYQRNGHTFTNSI